MLDGVTQGLADGLDEKVDALVADARDGLEELLGDFDTVEEEILDAAGISEAETEALDQMRAALQEVFSVFE